MFVDGADIEKNFVQKGEVIFREGDAGDAAYIVESGVIGIFKTLEGKKVNLAAMKDGELFGEMSIIDGARRMANAVAMEDSVIIKLPREGLEGMLAKQGPMVKTLINILVQNLRSVHDIYFKRPRSVHDYMDTIAFHTERFCDYLEIDKKVDPGGEGLERLRQIEEQLDVLRERFIGHEDKRDSVTVKPESIPFLNKRK